MTAKVFLGGVFLALALGFGGVLLCKYLFRPIRRLKIDLDVWVLRNLGGNRRRDWVNDRFLRQICDNHLSNYRRGLEEHFRSYTILSSVAIESLIIFAFITFVL